MICKHKSTKLHDSKYCYVSLTIQSSISHLFTQLNNQTVLFITIQSSMSFVFHLFLFFTISNSSSIWPRDRTLSVTTTPSQSEPESNGNEGVLCIPQSSNITGASPSVCLVSYPGHSLVGWREILLCRDTVCVFYSPSRLGCDS